MGVIDNIVVHPHVCSSGIVTNLKNIDVVSYNVKYEDSVFIVTINYKSEEVINFLSLYNKLRGTSEIKFAKDDVVLFTLSRCQLALVEMSSENMDECIVKFETLLIV